MSVLPKYKFKLYVAGDAGNSALALSNLKTLCRTRLTERAEIEVIDVLKNPERGLSDGVFMTPTLIKLSPTPMRKIVGTLSQSGPVLQALGLDPLVA